MINAISYEQGYEAILRGKTKIVKYSPTGTFANANMGETVTFNISDSNGLLDPLSTYVETTISFANNPNLANDATYSNKIIQLDHSAHSLFSSMTLQQNNTDLERIQEYDVLNCFLNDMNWGSSDRGMRDYEGAGTISGAGLPNSITTSFQIPSANTGTTQQVKSWMPWESNLNAYVDTSNRIYAFGTQTTGAITVPTTTANNYCSTHPQINNRLSFNPIGINDAAVTYSSGSNLTEIYNDFSNATVVSNPAVVGSLQYFTPDFCRTGFETFFSSTVLQRYMFNGFVKTDFITSATFYTKIRSGIIGELMPIERYRMVPLWLLPGLQLQLMFAQHAFFTSWFTPNQAARSYQVTSMYLHCTLFEPSQAIRDSINSQYLSGGIRIATQSFSLGPKNTVTNGAVPPSVQVNLGFESMRNFFFLFYPMDYTSNAMCRKHQRFSMGITSFQLRVGNDYYPSLPIQGNAGTNHGPVNNFRMVKHLYTCFGKHCGPSSCSINASNYAVSTTAVDPTLTSGAFYDNTQAALFEQNRVRGACVFGIPCDKLNFNHSVLGGINTLGQSPFQLDMAYSSARQFTRNVQLAVFIHHDIVLLIKKGMGGDPEVAVVK